MHSLKALTQKPIAMNLCTSTSSGSTTAAQTSTPPAAVADETAAAYDRVRDWHKANRYENELLAHPDDGGLFADEAMEEILDRFESGTTYSLAFAGIDAPGHGFRDMECPVLGSDLILLICCLLA